MKLFRSIAKFTPYWLVQLATDLRCRLRCKLIGGALAYRQASDKPALIVAPHPDDETFGCGGLIRLKRAAGVSVRVILLTDGEAVASGLGEKPESVVAARRREFTNACQALGLESETLRFLHLPDGRLPHPGQTGFDKAVKAVATEIESFGPGEIYCPHLLDVRPDHIAATLMTRAALNLAFAPTGGKGGRKPDEGAVSHPPPTLLYYPVWMWYHASSGLRKRLDCRDAWRLDISAGLSVKKQAMAAYLNSPQKTADGNPFCGRLPQSFLRNFNRPYEVYFPAKDL